jgi:predicted dehydrogenase
VDEENKTLNVGLVGCGRISAKHIWAIVAHPDVDLFGVYDIDKSKMPPNTVHYASYADMIGDPHIDIVSICTPSDLHAPMAIDAANAGKHVLLEKPIALKTSEANAVISFCKGNNVKLCVVVQNRFNLVVRRLKEWIDGDVLGKIIFASAICRWQRPRDYFSDWQSSWDRSGGVIVNQAIHSIDMLQWLVGPIDAVSARGGNQCHHDLEFFDTYVATLHFENGALGTYEATVCAYPQNAENSVSIIGTKGTVKIGGVALDQYSYMMTDGAKAGFKHSLVKKDVYGDGHLWQYREFASAIFEDRDPTTGGEDALRALKVTLEIHRSAKMGYERVTR